MSSINFASDSRLREETDNLFTTTGNFTISLWVYVTATLTPTSLRFSLCTNQFVLDSIGTDDIRFRSLGTTSFSTATNANALVQNTLYHIACTLDSSTPRLYVNGVEVATGAGVTSQTSGDGGLHLGETSNAMSGYYSDIRGWDRALTAAEIATIYASQGRDSIVGDQTMRWTAFEGAPGTTIIDNQIRDHSAPEVYTIDVQGATAISYQDENVVPVSSYRRRCA